VVEGEKLEACDSKSFLKSENSIETI